MKMMYENFIKKLVIIIGAFGISLTANAQSIGIGSTVFTPDASAMLEVQATNRGILIPRVALTSINDAATIPSPATSLLVYNTGTGGLSPAGYYYNAGTPAAPSWTLLITRAHAWLLAGNAGVDSATQFLGTTDARPVIIRTNNTARIRVLTSGQVLVNGTTPASSADLFDVFGNATYLYAINGYATANNGIGVYGQNAVSGAGGGAGVYGISLQTGAGGVVGDGLNNTRGTVGITNNANYAGVHAQQLHADGDAIFAANSAANGAATGSAIWATSGQTGGATIMAGLRSNSYFSGTTISAITDQSITNGRAIIAECSNTTGVSIHGQTSGTQAIAVLGINSSTTANINATGVWGQTSNPRGSGGYFANTAAAGTNDGIGVWAESRQSTGAAVYARNLHSSGTGVMASGNNVATSFLTLGSGGAFTSTNYGVAGFKNGALADNTGGGYFIASTTTNVGVCVACRSGGVNYKILNVGAFGGTASTDVLGLEGKKDRRIMFAPEATEIFLQDYGRGQLVNGKAHIKLDPIFARNIIVNDTFPLHVYIQLEGDCKGVYVANKTNESFDVIELQGGTSNVPFTYFVTGHRRDYIDPETGELISKHQGVRLPLAPEALPLSEFKREPLPNKEPVPSIERQKKADPLIVKPLKNLKHEE
ncbi:MAG: hypothetical protein N2Z72_02630 [Bacteroidales bacterium]|nr:hypothetical protein [Bacteroidales bacterium]